LATYDNGGTKSTNEVKTLWLSQWGRARTSVLHINRCLYMPCYSLSLSGMDSSFSIV